MPKLASQPIFFVSPAAFRAWLSRHHKTARELLVGFHKKGTGKPSLTWSESVDQALCFGWIDGVRRSLDSESYTIRFTPRRPGSTWSAINIRKVAALEKAGLMKPAGRTAFAARTRAKSQTYSYEQRKQAVLDPAQLKQFKSNRKAWLFFQTQAPSYRQTAIYWVASAKREGTRQERLAKLIAASSAGSRLT
jgi:uncharacterized protein YdeI (YjbR/CyaY-like superfamily)